jgi:hypothetical protein
MSMDTEIRTTLHQAVGATDAPTIDRVGFERRVRWHRRRRRAGMAGAVAAVAAAVLVVPLGLNQIDSDTTAASETAARPDPNRPPIYFSTEDGPSVLTPDGVVREVIRYTEATDTDGDHLLALTPDGGAIVVLREGGLVRLQVVGRDPWRFERIPLSDEEFGSGAASEDGRYFAASTADYIPQPEIVIFDLSTNQEVRRVPVSANIDDYSDRVLLEHRSSFTLGFGPNRVEIPATHHAMNYANAKAGGDIVAIDDPRPMTQLYDVSGGTARQIDTIEGHGALSPDGRYYLSPIQKEPGYRWELQKPLTLWEHGGDPSQPVTGLDDRAGTVRSIAWLDTETAAVTTSVSDRATIWTCEASTRQCEEVYSFPSTPGNFVSWLIGY